MTGFIDLDQLGSAELNDCIAELQARYNELKAVDRQLDLTRGRPSKRQLELSSQIDGILKGDFRISDGKDARSYSPSVYGIDEIRHWFAELMAVQPEQTLVNGSSSLQLIYFSILFASLFGAGGEIPWRNQGEIEFLCPVPGYDRHFRICEELGITMRPVPMDEHGPDMERVEQLVRNHQVKGIFCVPRFSNPSGIVYSDETVSRLAGLNSRAARDFRIIYDNAYAMHQLSDAAPQLSSIADACQDRGSEDLLLQFASTSKITFSGSGIAAMAASTSNLQRIGGHLRATSIGPDRVNQLRHIRFLPDMESLREHMRKQARLIAPKFQLIQSKLAAGLGDGRGGSTLGNWSNPQGGYFVMFNTRQGLAREVVRLAREVGLRLTPAGSTWPLGRDPLDSDIRIAPTAVQTEELDQAMDIFVLCVQLASAVALRDEAAAVTPRQLSG